MTTRTRAGFFQPHPQGLTVWVSYAGTNQDISMVFTAEQFTQALDLYKEHQKKIKTSYGMGVLMNFDEGNNLWSFDGVHEGMLITLAFEGQQLETIKGNIYATEEG